MNAQLASRALLHAPSARSSVGTSSPIPTGKIFELGPVVAGSSSDLQPWFEPRLDDRQGIRIRQTIELTFCSLGYCNL